MEPLERILTSRDGWLRPTHHHQNGHVMFAKILSPHVHRSLDFATVVIFSIAPVALGLTGAPRVLAWTLAVVHLAMTLFTGFGVTPKPVTLSQHGAVELVVGVVLLGLPPLLGWPGIAVAFYAAAGVAILLVCTLTRYQRASA